MADSQLGWSEAQWERVNNAVAESFAKASVASAFITRYGPLAGSVETVRNEKLTEEPDPSSKLKTVRLDGDGEDATQKLVNLTVRVELSSEQVADESLSNAILAFRRAASILALDEDDVVFNGFDPDRKESIVVANAPGRQEGIAEKRGDFRRLKNLEGRAVVSAVVRAIRDLEGESNPGPFACVMGNALFESVHRPSPSLVLPADRITPLLKGPLLRSGRMQDYTGIVVSLAGTVIDIVVGTPPTVQFLQRTQDAKFLFRVYERFVLRVRDKKNPPVAGFTIKAEGALPVMATANEAEKHAADKAKAAKIAAEKAQTAVEYAKTAAEDAQTAATEAAVAQKAADAAAGKVAADQAADAEERPEKS